ncbi:MAG: Bcr/CflA family efflux MFS transporter [Propionibacteriaceae bacterium]|nr:Bcr/CflA family efflux MFS transporter [Propionibacteriaceae bacterium]
MTGPEPRGPAGPPPERTPPAGPVAPATDKPFTNTAIAILILVNALAPLATATYLPALPIAQADLAASPVAMQLTLTTFILGSAVGQLIVGPISDRTGRKGALLVGLLLYVGASVGVALSPHVAWLIAWRVVQGIGAGAGMVLGRAIVADRATGVTAAKLLGLMMAIGVVAPAIAPLLGVALLRLTNWRGIFGTVVIVGVLLAVAIVLRLPETRPRGQGRSHGVVADRSGGSWRRFLALVAAGGLAFAAMYALIAAGPYLYQRQFGLSPEAYAGLTAVVSVGMGAVAFFGTRALGRSGPMGLVTPRLMAGIALVVLAAGALIVGAMHLLDAPVWAWIAALALAMLPAGLALGTLTALIMDAAPIPPGGASAIAGVVQAALGAAMPPIVGLGGDAPGGVMALALLISALAALTTFALSGGRRTGHAHRTPRPPRRS